MSVLEEVQSIIADILNVGDVSEDAELVRNLEADSLDIVDIAMAAESEFGVIITDDEMSAVTTVRDLVHLIESHI